MPYSKLKHVGLYATLFVKYHTLVIDTLYICCKRKKQAHDKNKGFMEISSEESRQELAARSKLTPYHRRLNFISKKNFCELVEVCWKIFWIFMKLKDLLERILSLSMQFSILYSYTNQEVSYQTHFWKTARNLGFTKD